MKKKIIIPVTILVIISIIFIVCACFLTDKDKNVIFKAYAEINENDKDYTLYIVSKETKINKNLTVWKFYSTDKLSNDGHIDLLPWYSLRNKISNVVVKDNIVPKDTSFWFYGFNNLKKIEGLEKIDTSNVINMSGMFNGVSSLETLDLSSFNMKNVKNTAGMFNNCTSLKTIYVDSVKWDLDNVKYSDNMFKEDLNLVGGNGTKYDATKINKEYAKIDEESNLGYLTKK